MKPSDFYHQIAREYISPFLDAGSQLNIHDRDSRSIHIEGTKRFQTFAADLLFLDSYPWLQRIRTRKGEEYGEDLRTFLSGPNLGDLKSLARSIIGHLKSRLGDPRKVVDARLQYEDTSDHQPAQRESLASEVIPRLLCSGSQGTRLTLLHGHAGTGKSWMLMNTALHQAQEYLTRQADSLYLYIDAQGLNLRSLAQQISYQLDLYNGVVRVAEVRPLLRLGALSLIVDGFDELIMPSGYNDTLTALASYIESLDGDGSILASARSAFFHSYDLASAGVRVKVPVDQNVLEVLPWREDERRQYCEAQGCPELIDRVEEWIHESQTSADLLGRPFVISRILERVQSGQEPADTELMMEIEQDFLERERKEKLLDEDGTPLLTTTQFQELLTDVALEMWHLRQTSIDLDTLKALVEIHLEDLGFDRETRQLLSHRIDSTPVLALQASEKQKIVQFPHEMLFARFLAHGILSLFARSDNVVEGALREAPLSESAVEQIALLSLHGDALALGSSSFTIDATFTSLSAMGDAISDRFDVDKNVRINIGEIAIALLKSLQISRRWTIRRACFSRSAFADTSLGETEFRECFFEEIDARGADWSQTNFADCPPINKMIATTGQRFPASLPPVLWLLIQERDGDTKEYFGETPTREALFPASGTTKATIRRSELSREVAELAERTAKRALRVFWMTEQEEDTDDRGMRALKRSGEWPVLMNLLDKHGLRRVESRSRRGVNAEMFHIERADELLHGVSGDLQNLSGAVRGFWQDVVTL